MIASPRTASLLPATPVLFLQDKCALNLRRSVKCMVMMASKMTQSRLPRKICFSTPAAKILEKPAGRMVFSTEARV